MGMATEGGAHPVPCPPGSSAGEDAGSRLAPASPALLSVGNTPWVTRCLWDVLAQ